MQILKSKCDKKNFKKLASLNNLEVLEFVNKYVKLCNPARVFVRTDSAEDADYIKKKAIENQEERRLNLPGHTVHFDGILDQARDKENTKFLISHKISLDSHINTIYRQQGLTEIHEYLKESMQQKEMYVCFFCLGPLKSEFSILAVQLTDSSYVAHSEGILYRSGYKEFKKNAHLKGFFRYVHSSGVLENGVSKNIDKRRIYIDIEDNIVYSVNTQYAGNTVGLKKLSLRLAIRKAFQEGWLAEHMLIMGVYGPRRSKSYFVGAFPSACGKTSTAMLPGETIVGDDIAYLRIRNGKVYGVNAECGIFGIIKDVNAKDDPYIWNALTSKGEVIFSNVLVTKQRIPYWQGDGRKIPERGINYSGVWFKGKKDNKGNLIAHSHSNARYTISLNKLKNRDSNLNCPEGVKIDAIIYGGRDSDTWPCVQQSFNWNHGVVTMAASLESETTSATLGDVGVRKFNPMSNLDFLSISIRDYISSHLKFSNKLRKPPLIFAVNYFLKSEDGKFLTSMEDKHIWIKWMKLRCSNDVDVIKTPISYIPKFDDLKKLFKGILGKDYRQQDYRQQFSIRVPENIAKIDRIEEIYKTLIRDVPDILFKILKEQKQRLFQAKRRFGDFIHPEEFIKL